MQLEPEQIRDLNSDIVLVEMLLPPEKVGSFYVPDMARKVTDQRRKRAWRARVVRFGPEVDVKSWGRYGEKVKPGVVVHVNPVALDCPSFKMTMEDGDKHFLFVRDEDLLAVEAEEKA